jgi:hypothetical protein
MAMFMDVSTMFQYCTFEVTKEILGIPHCLTTHFPAHWPTSSTGAGYIRRSQLINTEDANIPDIIWFEVGTQVNGQSFKFECVAAGQTQAVIRITGGGIDMFKVYDFNLPQNQKREQVFLQT